VACSLSRIPLLCLAFVPQLATAQTDAPAASSDTGSWAFQWENDLFAKGRNDRYYTNGMRLVYSRPARLLAEKPANGFVGWYGDKTGTWLCSLVKCIDGRTNVVVDTHGGQNMYTPQNLRRVTYNPYDRPYGGWLYLGQRTSLIDLPDKDDDGTRLQVLDVSLGVVGPSAGAGKVQEEWHRLVNAIDPQGWSTQLRDELGVLVSYTYKRRVPLSAVIDTLPYGRLMVGNVFTHAAVGTQFRLGRDLGGFGHFDPIPSFALASKSADSRVQKRKEPTVQRDSPLYAFVAVEAKAVARNIFLDGNTFRDYPATSFISRKALVGDFTLGFSAKLSKDFRVTYGHTWRTKEFEQTRTPPPGSPRSETQRYGVVQLQCEY
jgi:hypothetical protein